jgi:paraquat-inducible protein B
VDIDFLPDRPGRLVGEVLLGLPEIPTVPSSKDEIEKTVQQVAKEVRELPLKDTVDAMLGAIRRVDHLLAKPETGASLENLNRTLDASQQLLRHLDGKVDGMTGQLDTTAREIQKLVRHLDTAVVTLTATLDGAAKDGRVLINQLNRQAPPLLDTATGTLQQAKGTLSAIESLTEPDAELSTALRDLSEAARAMRRLADSLERHPEALLYGRNKPDARR